ncbi:hypothetical protein [Halorarius halobius]|uniref:hypothetical protein n=1 Tax=Halorarius halobius TaxID=2962671 RepID=UPI0020CF4A95|nr:hypothetical protein [Halorarius halobius]
MASERRACWVLTFATVAAVAVVLDNLRRGRATVAMQVAPFAALGLTTRGAVAPFVDA